MTKDLTRYEFNQRFTRILPGPAALGDSLTAQIEGAIGTWDVLVVDEETGVAYLGRSGEGDEFNDRMLDEVAHYVDVRRGEF